MSDITTIVPPLIINRHTESVNDQQSQKRDDDQGQEDQKKRQSSNTEQPAHPHITHDEMMISLLALEEKIIEDATTLLGFYDDIPTNEIELEEEHSQETAKPLYNTVINSYQKVQAQLPNQHQTYTKKEFPVRIPESVSTEKLLIIEHLLDYWNALESLREKGIEKMPHQEGNSLYTSFARFLSLNQF